MRRLFVTWLRSSFLGLAWPRRLPCRMKSNSRLAPTESLARQQPQLVTRLPMGGL